ncbi:tryptophan synthase subunit alpha [Deltaproteobacteria bacterium TL4]
MNLAHYLKKQLSRKKILLMTHLIVGYPSLAENRTMLQCMQEAGVDLVELQMPFSEPIADGPMFVRANQAALSHGTVWNDYFELMKTSTEQYSFPFLFMGYYNAAFTMGHEAFCTRIQESGGCGYILADLPVEEFGDLFQYSEAHNLSPIFLFTPTNTDERLAEIGKHGKGFIYSVARKGVTGKKTEMSEEVTHFIKRCRQATQLPLALGFGLSDAEDLQALQGKVEIAIVGTALLKTWEEGGKAAYQAHLERLVKGCS